MQNQFDANLEKYAEVIVKVGLNVQPGQRLLVGVPRFGAYGTAIELAPLVRYIAEKAYQAGVRLVDVLWNDDQLRLLRFQHAPRDSFSEFPTWRTDAAYDIVKEGNALLSLASHDPGLLLGQDPELISLHLQTNMIFAKPVFELRAKNATNWCTATAPVEGWIDRVYPDVDQEDRADSFWKDLFHICRVDHADPIAAWHEHLSILQKRRDYLNDLQIETLFFSGPGTDLQIGLPDGHIWTSGHMKSRNGIQFTGNIPTEEIFTLPHSLKVEGVVKSTKSLARGGFLVEDFTLTFMNGEVIDAKARVGEDDLHKLLGTDDGVRRLGEVALVANSSPISQLDRLFYLPLIDENASVHLALGNAYRFNMINGDELSDEEFIASGGNLSLNHIDFMIGSSEMQIDGLKKDGVIVPIFRDGEWSLEI